MTSLPPITRLDELDPDSEIARVLHDESPEACQEWIETYLTVPNELGQVVKMKLYPQQRLILQNQTGRDVTVKGRQTRASSILLARNLRWFTSGEVWGATWLVGAQDDATTATFRQRIKHHLFNDLNRKGFSYETLLDNDDELVLAGLENRIKWASGEMKTMSRGYAVQRVHLSELAHWGQKALELIGGVLPAVPPPPFGCADMESTPKGETGAFYDYATDAKPLNPQSLWTVHLYPWWTEPRYTVSDDHRSGCDIVLATSELAQREREFVATDREAKIMSSFGLDIRRILWRRLKKDEQDRTHAPFLQEYPEDIDTCWLGLEGKFFDTPDGIDHLEYYREEKRHPVRFLEKLTYNGAEVSFFGPNLALWELPNINDDYVGGFDTAGGGVGKDSDYSVLYVMSVQKEKIVARLRVQASPKAFAAMVCAVANFFKSATVNGERSHQGDLVFTEMRDLQYRHIYYHVDPMKALRNTKERPQAGLYPTTANRQMILERFKTAITTGSLRSFCAELVREMNVFTWQKVQQRMKASALDLVGQHDDCIFAAAYCWFIVDKVRSRLRANSRQAEQEIIGVGPNNMVVRRSDHEMPRRSQVWFT